jgi:death-on-curing protein
MSQRTVHRLYCDFEKEGAWLNAMAAKGLHLIRNHPLLDGNKRVGYLCLVEFVERNGRVWSPPPADVPCGDETVDIIEGVAAGGVSQASLPLWMEKRATPRTCG